MANPIIIFGCGSMARVLYSFLKQANIRVAAFVADDEFVHDKEFLGLPLIKCTNLHLFVSPTAFDFMMAIGFHEMNAIRKERFDWLCGLGFRFAEFGHESVVKHDDVLVSSGMVIYDNVAIHAGSKIGLNVFISSNVSVGHDCDIDDHAWINSGVSLGGGVKVGARCVLSMNACVAQGVTLGEGTYVGAGTLVTKDTKPNSVIVSKNSFELIDTDSKRFLKLARQP